MKVIFAGGATGGHLYPALAIAKKLKEKYPDMEALFVTSRWVYSREVIESNGYEVRNIDVAGIDRRHLLNNLTIFKDLAVSSRQIKDILEEFQPDIVIGTGGNVSGSVIRIAHKKGIPTFLHEQNVLPGLSNKLTEKYVDKIFVAFEASKAHFKKEKKIIVTGNPVREEFLADDFTEYRKKLIDDSVDLVLLFFGGSQGADKINDVASEYMISVKDRQDIEIFFLTGKDMYKEVLDNLSDTGVLENKRFHVLEYAGNIHELYAASDIIVSRAGALSISEFTVMGKAPILIPSPNVSGNHQLYNAKTMTDKGAAVLIEEKDLNLSTLKEEIDNLWNNKEAFRKMSDAAKDLGCADAADKIVEEIEKMINAEKKEM